MTQPQDKTRADFEAHAKRNGLCIDRAPCQRGLSEKYWSAQTQHTWEGWTAASSFVAPASSEQQAAQQDAERWRAFSQGAVFPKLAFNNGNSHWQYGEIRGLSANAVADLVIAARASNGGKA